MASPQTENGYTKIANEIMEALMQTQLSGYQSRILFAIWRKTYGWNKKEDKILSSQLAELTGILLPHVSFTVKNLINRNMITEIGKNLSFNKNYEEWKDLPKSVTKKKLPKSVKDVTEIGNDFTENGNKRLPKSVIINRGNANKNKDKLTPKEKKETITKETIKDKFEIFRKKYFGTKKGLDNEFKNFTKKQKQPSEVIDLLLPALEREIKNKEALKQSGEFCPSWKNLQTWINQECWTQEFPEIENQEPEKMGVLGKDGEVKR